MIANHKVPAPYEDGEDEVNALDTLSDIRNAAHVMRAPLELKVVEYQALTP